jgi:hypothetical protein
MSDRLIALVLVAVCGFIYWQSYAIRKPSFAAFEGFNAGTFPRAIVVVLAIFCLVLLVRGTGALVPRRPTQDDLRRWAARYRLPLISLPLFAAYAAAMGAIGWFADTAAYLIAMQLVLQPRGGGRLAIVVAGSLAFTWALGLGFEGLLHIVLPKPGLF